MHCAHCCMRATKKGDTMPMTVVRKALALARENYWNITLGGGEPTLHPRFEEILCAAMVANQSDIGVYIATNGSHRERSLLLAKFSACEELITVKLSDDQFHDATMVHPDVRRAFNNIAWISEQRRWESSHLPMPSGWQPKKFRLEHIVNQGRAKDNNIGTREGCVCETLTVGPRGQMRGCACPEAPDFGNVMERPEVPEGWSDNDCSFQEENLTLWKRPHHRRRSAG